MAKGEDVMDRVAIDREGMTGQREQRLQLRGEGEAARLLRHVERLDAERIAHQPQPPLGTVPQRHREHPLEPRPGAVAPRLEGDQDRLGVAAGAKAPACRLKLGAQRRMVVDFSVEDDREPPVD